MGGGSAFSEGLRFRVPVDKNEGVVKQLLSCLSTDTQP